MMIPDYEKITAFWCEVQDTIENLFSEDDEFNAGHLLKLYEESLKEIDQNLTFHFEKDDEAERIEMIFGCDGYAQSIASVLSLVEAAPVIDGIQIVAFNSRHDPLPACIRVGDDDFALERFWFASRLTDGEYHLSVFLDEPGDTGENPQVEAAMIYLDAVLGEFDLMTRVSTLSWYPLPVEPLDHGLKPLGELRAVFDAQRTEINLIGVTLH